MGGMAQCGDCGEYSDHLALLHLESCPTKARLVNAQHSSNSDSWRTPVYILNLVHEMLEYIDLDPASSVAGNETVKATRFYTKEDDGLVQPWKGNIFVNPPGGKINNKSLAGLFWKKLIEERENNITHAIFLAFSIEALADTQGKGYYSVMDFPICVPAKRIRFDKEDGTPGNSPTHANVIVYVPGMINQTDKFVEIFSRIGTCKR